MAKSYAQNSRESSSIGNKSASSTTNGNQIGAASGNQTSSSITIGNKTSVARVRSSINVITVDNTNLDFTVKFEMAQLNGSAAHEHNVTDLKTSYVAFENNTVTIKGRGTVTMKAGPADGIPLTIRIINNAVPALAIVPDNVNSRFGAEQFMVQLQWSAHSGSASESIFPFLFVISLQKALTRLHMPT